MVRSSSVLRGGIALGSVLALIGSGLPAASSAAEAAPPPGASAAAAGATPLPATSHPPAPAPPQIARDGWKDCTFNDQLIRCLDAQTPDTLRIVWIDGLRSSFQLRPAQRPGLPVYWGDRYGGLWRRELLPQGNTLLTHLGNGNRILVPLRFPCRPPLRGEVGYCQPPLPR